MRKQKYQRASVMAAAMAAVDPDAADYWLGYQRGLRRAHFGEQFGTADVHRLWLTIADEGGDRRQREWGRGYRDGLAAKSK
jgi:hypothetical protein